MTKQREGRVMSANPMLRLPCLHKSASPKSHFPAFPTFALGSKNKGFLLYISRYFRTFVPKSYEYERENKQLDTVLCDDGAGVDNDCM